jgi:hypothetical protein
MGAFRWTNSFSDPGQLQSIVLQALGFSVKGKLILTVDKAIPATHAPRPPGACFDRDAVSTVLALVPPAISADALLTQSRCTNLKKRLVFPSLVSS